MHFVQCTVCGGVVGVVPFYDPGLEAHEANRSINEIKSLLKNLEYDINFIRSQIK